MEDGILRGLALGPPSKVRVFKQYVVNGFRFDTYKYGEHKCTMNYGVCVNIDSGGKYYGILMEVVELMYTSISKSYPVILFQCAWFDPHKGTRVDPKYHLVDIHQRKFLKYYDPFILASQAQQVSYSSYPSLKKDKANWMAVYNIKARSMVDVGTEDYIEFQEDVIVDQPTLGEIEFTDISPDLYLDQDEMFEDVVGDEEDEEDVLGDEDDEEDEEDEEDIEEDEEDDDEDDD